MNESLDRVEVMFAAAVALAPQQRSAYLDQACSDDAALRARVEELLQAHDRKDHLLDRPAADDPHRTLSRDNVRPTRIGAVIAGRYKLLEEIGEGGMGAVWVAEQLEPVRRRVALKLIKPGMDTRQVLSRFEAERQALALMDHPNIAKVFDGGMTSEGRPFFVMEYVKGLPITQYCDETRLTIAERLGLFTQVCQAVQHAHQKGIIHRDLKPSNILVCLYDGVAVPKVIDFGLAKAMHQSLTENTLYTAHGMMVGTPLYMSPEQAEFNNLDIDTRSDVYSLGVILYELLTGTTPLERRRFQQAAWQEMLRLIKEEEPPRPSARLSSTDTLASVAASRQSEPARLTRLVRGELDWIVLKALEKDRRRRYETATGFAADVQRYLADEAVQACPPSAAYRFGKFARRNKGLLASLSVVGVALIAAVVVLAVSNVWVGRERDQKDQALREKTVALAEARASAEQARRAVDEMLTEVGENTLNNEPHMSEVQVALLEKALRFHQEFLQRWGATPELRSEAAKAYRRVGDIHRKLGRKEDAEAAYQQALTVQRQLMQEFPSQADYVREVATTHFNRGEMRRIWKNLAEWERSHRQALALRESLVADDPRNDRLRLELAKSCQALAKLLFYDAVPRQSDEPEALHRRAVKICLGLAAEFPSDTRYQAGLAGAYHELANVCAQTGRVKEAEEHYRSGLKAAQEAFKDTPEIHRDRHLIAIANLGIGDCLRRQGKPQAAVAAFQQGVPVVEKLAANFPGEPKYQRDLCQMLYDYGDVLKEAGRFEDAERAYRQSVDLNLLVADQYPGLYSWLTPALDRFSKFLQDQGRQDEAATLIAESIARSHHLMVGDGSKGLNEYQRHLVDWCFNRFNQLKPLPPPLPDDIKDGGAPYLKIGLLLTAGGHHQLAAKAYRRCLEVAPGNASGHDRLARLSANCQQVELRDPAGAVELSGRATEIVPREGSFWNTRGLAHYRAGHWKLAAEALNQSMSLRDGGDGFDWIVMAMTQWQLGDHDAAQTCYDKAAAWLEKQGSTSEEARRLQAEAEALLKLKEPSPAPGHS